MTDDTPSPSEEQRGPSAPAISAALRKDAWKISLEVRDPNVPITLGAQDRVARYSATPDGITPPFVDIPLSQGARWQVVPSISCGGSTAGKTGFNDAGEKYVVADVKHPFDFQGCAFGVQATFSLGGKKDGGGRSK